jgi:hypothetical protein
MFNRENPQNSEPQNGPRSGLDYIALALTAMLGQLCYIASSNLIIVISLQ